MCYFQGIWVFIIYNNIVVWWFYLRHDFNIYHKKLPTPWHRSNINVNTELSDIQYSEALFHFYIFKKEMNSGMAKWRNPYLLIYNVNMIQNKSPTMYTPTHKYKASTNLNVSNPWMVLNLALSAFILAVCARSLTYRYFIKLAFFGQLPIHSPLLGEAE